MRLLDVSWRSEGRFLYTREVLTCDGYVSGHDLYSVMSLSSLTLHDACGLTALALHFLVH